MGDIHYLDLQKNFRHKREEISDIRDESWVHSQQQFILRQAELGERWKLKIDRNIEALNKKIETLKQYTSGIIRIQRLPSYNLMRAIDVIVEPDSDGFIARTIDLPLYAHSNDSVEAIEALKDEIETLYEDLLEDDNYTSEWLRIKEFLRNCIESG